MQKLLKYSRAFLLLALVAATVDGQGNRAIAQEAETELIQYASGSSDVIIELYQTYEILEQNPRPRFTLFGDGRILVYFPPFMKRAGEYELILSTTEMEELLLFLSSREAFSFDASKVQEEKKSLRQAQLRQAQQGTIQVTYRSDETISTLHSRLSSYTPAGVGAKSVQNYTKKISWQGLQNDAKDHPEIRSLVNLAEAEATLLAYCNDVNLKKIEK